MDMCCNFLYGCALQVVCLPISGKKYRQFRGDGGIVMDQLEQVCITSEVKWEDMYNLNSVYECLHINGVHYVYLNYV